MEITVRTIRPMPQTTIRVMIRPPRARTVESGTEVSIALGSAAVNSLKQRAPAGQHLMHVRGADDLLLGQRKLDRSEDERPRLGPAHAAVERDQLLERAAALEGRVVEAVHVDVRRVLEAVGAEQVPSSVRRE